MTRFSDIVFLVKGEEVDLIIYWFSGTGNSRAVAEDLASELGEGRLESIAEFDHVEEPPTAATVVLTFPVYAFNLPQIVDRFLRRLAVGPETDVYTVATMAKIPGQPHGRAARILRRKNATLKGGWSVAMPGNYTVFYGAIPPERRDRLFDEERLKVARIAEVVRAGGRSGREDSFSPINWIGRMIQSSVGKTMAREDRKFNTLDNCDGCGICVRVCPVANIEIVAGRPEWLHHCEQCFACLQWCPREALQCGKITRGRGRYRHPRYEGQDFFRSTV